MIVRYKKVFISFLTLLCLNVQAQSVSQIQVDRSYLSGEGWGNTLKQADDAALQDLISKISVNVRSSFSSAEEETNNNGRLDSKSVYTSIIKTYSQATLTNTQRIVIENEPDAHVLRYVKVSEIDRIFEGRKAKVLDMVESAERAEKKAKIDDALRYYYWSLCLLKSIRYSNEVKYISSDGKSHLLINWIPEKMKEIFSKISIRPIGFNGSELVLNIMYNGNPINSFDYTYFDGMDWSNIYSAKDGQGVVDLRPGRISDNLRLKCEYEFAGESHIDKEIENVMALTGGLSFRDAYFNVDTKNLSQTAAQHTARATITPIGIKSQTSDITDYSSHLTIIENVAKGISQKKYENLEEHFTTKGWGQFKKLIQYGRAALIDKADLQMNSLGDKVICRGLCMSFSFKNNNRKFVEDVVFTFDNRKKIDEVLFGLGKDAYNDIMMKGVWDMDARLILVNFLEEYKTAYALKDIDFIRNVFDDNAVIITGRMTSRPKSVIENSGYIDSKIVKYNRQTKNEYLRNLEHCFAGNEFINIRFANNDVIKAGKGGETYGIQIKQDYYSSTYGDTGYLFLMVDVNDPDSPSIKVRTWQPEKDPDFGIYGLSNF
ncbi:MAG: LPP20 family lipoprotein [Prevotella sp.]|nr:LPP20 family lipoprotein [Prevotella sp.]